MNQLRAASTLSPTPGPARRSETRFRAGRTLAIAAAATLISATGLPAMAAPGDTSSGTTVANVQVTSAISLTALTPSFTLVGLPRATVSADGEVAFNVETNNAAGYTVTVQSESATLDPADSNNSDTIPISNLQVRERGDGAYTALSDTDSVAVHSQATRSAEGGDDVLNDYQVDIPFVASDTYSATLDYVATAL